MGTFVSAYGNRWNAFGFGRSGALDGMGFREVVAAVPAAAPLDQGRREASSRAYERPDGSRVGRPLAGSGTAAPTGHRIDITV